MKTPLLLSVGVVVVLAPALGYAAPLFGNVSIAGLANAVVAVDSLTFLCSGVCPAGYGDFTTTAGASSFAPLVGTTGYFHNLSQATTPLNQPFLLSYFLVWPATDVAFDLTFIFLGVSGTAQCGAAPAAGQICTPAGIATLVTPANPGGTSPYNLQNTAAGGSTASFDVAGSVRNISTGELSSFTGTFSSQFPVPYQTILAELATKEGTVENPFSAFLTTPTEVPEPSQLHLLLGVGLVLAGVWWKRSLRRS